jgi:hypothetical protein
MKCWDSKLLIQFIDREINNNKSGTKIKIKIESGEFNNEMSYMKVLISVARMTQGTQSRAIFIFILFHFINLYIYFIFVKQGIWDHCWLTLLLKLVIVNNEYSHKK